MRLSRKPKQNHCATRFRLFRQRIAVYQPASPMAALIGCPKLDEGDYTQKLTEILQQNDIRSLTIVRMEVPCCGGIQMAAQNALKASGKFIPWQVVVIGTDGQILEK